jgi:hypothetical protein
MYMNTMDNYLKEFTFLNVEIDDDATIVEQVNKLSEQDKEGYKANGIVIDDYLRKTHIDQMQQSILRSFLADLMAIGEKNKTTLDIEEYTKKINRENSLKKVFDEKLANKNYVMNTAQAQRLIYEKIEEICERVNPNVIVVNGSIGSSLQDLYEFKHMMGVGGTSIKQSLNFNKTHYQIGEIFDTPVYVDAFMRFNDTRVLIANVDCTIYHNNNESFNKDFTNFKFGYDIKLNPNTKAEVLNIVDTNMFLF